MSMKKRIKQKEIILGIMIIGLIILASYFIRGYEIKKANINGYEFLKRLSSCDIQYKIDISTGKTVSDFKQECFENAFVYLKKIKFKPGSIAGEKLLVDSNEYNYCYYIRNMQGVEAYKKCIKEILPLLTEKYPEVIED